VNENEKSAGGNGRQQPEKRNAERQAAGNQAGRQEAAGRQAERQNDKVQSAARSNGDRKNVSKNGRYRTPSSPRRRNGRNLQAVTRVRGVFRITRQVNGGRPCRRICEKRSGAGNLVTRSAQNSAGRRMAGGGVRGRREPWRIQVVQTSRRYGIR